MSHATSAHPVMRSPSHYQKERRNRNSTLASMLYRERSYRHITKWRSIKNISSQSAVHAFSAGLATSRGITNSVNAINDTRSSTNAMKPEEDMKGKERRGSNLSLLASGVANHNLSVDEQTTATESIKMVVVTKMCYFLYVMAST